MDLVVRATEAALRRVGGPLETIDVGLDRVIGLLSGLLAAIPQPIVAVIAGLLVWRWRTFARAVVVILGLHAVLLAGGWQAAMNDVAFAAVTGGLGLGVIVVVDLVTSKRATSFGAPVHRAPAVTLAVSVVVISGLPLYGPAGTQPWSLAAVVFCVILGVLLAPPATPSTQGRLGAPLITATTLGLAAALLTGLFAERGLGALAVHAAASGTTELAAEALVATMGVTIALVAIAGPARSARPATESLPQDSGVDEAEVSNVNGEATP